MKEKLQSILDFVNLHKCTIDKTGIEKLQTELKEAQSLLPAEVDASAPPVDPNAPKTQAP